MLIPNNLTLKIRETRDYLKFLRLFGFFALQHDNGVIKGLKTLP
jgi:hypothetical protein